MDDRLDSFAGTHHRLLPTRLAERLGVYRMEAERHIDPGEIATETQMIYVN